MHAKTAAMSGTGQILRQYRSGMHTKERLSSIEFNIFRRVLQVIYGVLSDVCYFCILLCVDSCKNKTPDSLKIWYTVAAMLRRNIHAGKKLTDIHRISVNPYNKRPSLALRSDISLASLARN